jgi:hypothetical protein
VYHLSSSGQPFAYLRGLKGIIKDVAMILTECDLIKFNQYLIILNHPSIPVHQKQEAALFSKHMNDALKTLHNKVNERDFSIFYNSCFKGQNRNDIATALNVDASTVTRNRIKVLKELSIILYPDINILEMFA